MLAVTATSRLSSRIGGAIASSSLRATSVA
jgi:hypothetical protein